MSNEQICILLVAAFLAGGLVHSLMQQLEIPLDKDDHDAPD